MLNRLTNHFSTVLPHNLRPIAVRVPHVNPFQTALEQRPQPAMFSLGQGGGELSPLRNFHPPFLQITQAINNTYPPVAMPMPVSTELAPSSGHIDGVVLWNEFSRGLFNWWSTVRRDLFNLLPQWGVPERQQPARLLPGEPSWMPNVLVKVLEVSMGQARGADIVQFSAPLPRMSFSRNHARIDSQTTADDSVSIAQYPSFFSSALNQVVSPSNPQSISDFPIAIAQSVASSRHDFNPVNILSIDQPSSTTFPNRDSQALPRPAPFSWQNERGPTVISSSPDFSAEIVQIMANPPAAAPMAPPVPQPSPQPSPPAQVPTAETSGPTTINLNGGIHVQIAAQRIDRSHAEETARAIAGHVLKEINRITDRDRFRRGLPPNR